MIQVARIVPNFEAAKRFRGVVCKGRFDSGRMIHAQWFKPNEISWPDSNMNRLLQSQAAFLASRVRNQPRDTIPFFDPTFFSIKSTLVFACLFFCKTNTSFLISIIHTINNEKSNWIKKIGHLDFNFSSKIACYFSKYPKIIIFFLSFWLIHHLETLREAYSRNGMLRTLSHHKKEKPKQFHNEKHSLQKCLRL